MNNKVETILGFKLTDLIFKNKDSQNKHNSFVAEYLNFEDCEKMWILISNNSMFYLVEYASKNNLYSYTISLIRYKPNLSCGT